MSIGSIIEATPGICGGRSRLAGTRVPVHRVARYHRLGCAPEEMLGLLNSLSLSQIYAALAYALANLDEIEESFREEDDTADVLLEAPPGAPPMTTENVKRMLAP